MKNEDYNYEDLISRTDRSLEHLDVVDEIIKQNSSAFNKLHTETLIKKFSAYNTEHIELDGYAKIRISEDGMTASADFYPPSPGMSPLSYDAFLELLNEEKISYGINYEIIKDTILECNTEQKIINNIIFAAGKTEKNEVLKYIKIEEDLFHSEKPDYEYSGNVDFREYKNYRIIEKGEKLAEVIPLKKGDEGITVYGDIIPFEIDKKKNIIPGKNTEFKETLIVSSCEGIFKIDNEKFWIEEVLIVNSDVDYNTGNIDYKGDVIINGIIKDTFKLTSGGNVYCSQTLDASEVYCGNDLIVKNGIIGKNNGIVRVNKSVRAKFIEHCNLESEDSIYLEVGAMNSYIYSNNKVITSKKGLLVGGVIYATNGIITTQIGTKMGPKTEIYCGTDYKISNKMDWIKDKTIELASQLYKIKAKMKSEKLDKVQMEKLSKYKDQIQGAIHKMNDASIMLLPRIDRNSEADIIVRGSVYPGTYIEISHISFIVNKEIKNIRIRLDKRSGKIVTDQIN